MAKKEGEKRRIVDRVAVGKSRAAGGREPLLRPIYAVAFRPSPVQECSFFLFLGHTP